MYGPYPYCINNKNFLAEYKQRQVINLQQVKMSVSQQIIKHRFTLMIYLKSQEETYPNMLVIPPLL
jgi:hypothetical protein